MLSFANDIAIVSSIKRCHLLILLIASGAHYLSASMAQRRMEKKFEDNAARPLFSGIMVSIWP